MKSREASSWLAQLVEVDVEQLPFHFRILPATSRSRRWCGPSARRPAGHLVERRHVDPGGVEDDDVGFLARRERADLVVEPQRLGAVHGGVAQHVARGQQAEAASEVGHWLARRCSVLRIETVVRRFFRSCRRVLLQDQLVRHHALHVHGHAHLGEEVRRHRALDVDRERRLHAKLLHLDDRRGAMPHVHLDREGDRDLRALILDRLPRPCGLAGHVDEQVVGPDPNVFR